MAHKISNYGQSFMLPYIASCPFPLGFMSRPRREQYLPNTYAIDAALIDYAYLSLIAVGYSSGYHMARVGGLALHPSA